MKSTVSAHGCGKHQTRRISTAVRLLGIGLMGAGTLATPASATDYVDTMPIALESLRCGFFVKTLLCGTLVPFADGPRATVIGDTYQVDVDFDARLLVGASTGRGFLQVAIINDTAVFGGGAPGPYEALASLSLKDYVGAAPTWSGPQPTNLNFGYHADAGFCCDGANPPFSTTGAIANIKITGAPENPRPLTGVVVGYLLTLADIPKVLADFQGGSPNSPVILPEGLIGQITGNIGGAYSTQQYYGFQWEGGLFQTNASIFGTQPAESFQFKLWDSADNLISNVTLNAGNDFAGLMTVGSLASGPYKIGLQAGNIPDPGFLINFITPVGISAAVPEPATWAMMIVGFCFAGVALRRSRPRIEVTFA